MESWIPIDEIDENTRLELYDILSGKYANGFYSQISKKEEAISVKCVVCGSVRNLTKEEAFLPVGTVKPLCTCENTVEKIAQILCDKIDGKGKIRGSSYEELRRTIEDSEYEGCFPLRHCKSSVYHYREKAKEFLVSEIEPGVTLKNIIDYYHDEDKYAICPICGIFRYYTEEEKVLFNKGLIDSEKIKPCCNCLKDNNNAIKENK